MFAAIEQVASGGDPSIVEYWHGDGVWRGRRPAGIRGPALVHEGATLWIGEEDAPVGLDYRLRGIANLQAAASTMDGPG